MRHDLYLGAYWGARRESIDKCADKLSRMFLELAECSEVLSQWYKPGRTREEAREHRVDCSDRKCLWQLLESGRHRSDLDSQTVFEDMGFHVALWNGGDEDHMSGISVSCGYFGANPGISNCVVVDLPGVLGALGEAQRMGACLATVCRNWQPEWAGVMSRKARGLRRVDSRKPFVDWMIYVSREFVPDPPPVVSPATLLEIGSTGWIIVTQQTPPDPENPEHLWNVKAVEALLEDSVVDYLVAREAREANFRRELGLDD